MQRNEEKCREMKRNAEKCRYAEIIHSKSEDPYPNYPAKKFEFSANLSKNATKWPKNGQK